MQPNVVASEDPREISTAVQSALTEYTRYPLLRKALIEQAPDAPVHLLAIGKAAYQMALIAAQSITSRRLKSCIVLTKYGFFPAEAQPCFKPLLLEAGHPIPDANSIQNSRYILDWLAQIPADEELIVLLSGGSSALFEVPAPGHSLAELIALNSLLLKSGLDIALINAKRKEYSMVKAGKAAEAFQGKDLRVFLLSDVPGNDPAIIGSGPFYRGGTHSLPGAPSDHLIIGDNQSFLRLLAKRLKSEYPSLPLRVSPRFVQEDADAFAKALAGYAHTAQPGIYLFGGECSLKVQGRGRGGRLSHLALRFARELFTTRHVQLCAFATDGNDNLPDSAGARVNQDTYRVLQKLGKPSQALADYDSFSILKLADGIIPGTYTGCNVNDILILRVG
jgi:hydroxypyruvate reductase